MLEYDFWGDDTLAREPLFDEIERLRRSRDHESSKPLPGIVAESWKRCLADYNLAPDNVPRAEVLTHYEFRSIAQDHEDLLAVAEAEVEKLFLRLVDSEYLVSLASANGVMMLFRCDHQLLGDMSRLGVLPGSVWAEDRQGTNGVGTCLRAGRSVVIAGKQHYGLATQALSCITAPVVGRRQALQSVINVTTARVSDDRTNRVVLDIVERSARRIENRYFARLHRHSNLLRLFHDTESTDLAEEGRVAIDDNGLVVDASSQVTTLTGLPTDEIIGRPADEVFCMDLSLADIRPDRAYPIPFSGKNLQVVFNQPEARRSRSVTAHTADMATSMLPAMFVSPLQGLGLAEKDFRVDPMISLLLERAEKLYNAGMPLIVGGETGSGKTAFAQMIARRCLEGETETLFIDCAAVSSQRAGVAVFCSQPLLRRKICLVLERLDELDESGQIALQTLLENRDQRATERIGIIGLIGSDFAQFAKSGKLRSGLLHRLNGGTVFLPPLRSHPDLAGVVNDLFKLESHHLGQRELRLSDEARLVMLNYHWPGNLRELRNALRHAVVLAESDRIGLEHLPEDIVSEIARTDLTARSKSQTSRIEAALRHNGGNVSLTARYLGVSRATLYRKIQIQKSREKTSEVESTGRESKTKASGCALFG
jgi:transcriptional regulator of acetoin/glycerol metabolism